MCASVRLPDVWGNDLGQAFGPISEEHEGASDVRGRAKIGPLHEGTGRSHQGFDWLAFFFQAEDGIRDYKVTSSDVCSSDLRSSILVETLAPPMMAITGLVGASSTLLSASSSACMARPA